MAFPPILVSRSSRSAASSYAPLSANRIDITHSTPHSISIIIMLTIMPSFLLDFRQFNAFIWSLVECIAEAKQIIKCIFEEQAIYFSFIGLATVFFFLAGNWSE